MSEEKTASPTVRDLAQLLNISASTVSLALRNDPRVAVKTRERVVAAAQAAGYSMNPAIASLMSQVRSSRKVSYRETIGWLNLWDHPDTYTKTGVEFQLKMWQGAKNRAENLGYSLENFWLAAPEMRAKRMTAILTARGIRGLLVPPFPHSMGRLSIEWKNFTAVAMSYTMARPKLDRVIPDHYGNLLTILRELKHRGYKRPGLLIPKGYDDRTGNRLLAAFYFTQQSMPLSNRVPPEMADPEKLEDKNFAWLEKYRPDVLITAGIYKDIKSEAGLDPDYRAKLGLVLISHAGTDAGICGIYENPEIIGATAVEQLVLSLQRNELGLPARPRLIQIEGTWVEGNSAPRLTKRTPRQI
ncbi:LacI family DNA-binding transcriptional regulator [Coraliomargarita parva]|uniref:LacI family DNA-binding transcriptional regulator n=1 Tax=Coraliomargarita parva TaxID=3014050 RepID=UPI0022B36AD5|nr:LacI family DNA-binding transcriptional regulator [Coraliomargarita parva]